MKKKMRTPIPFVLMVFLYGLLHWQTLWAQDRDAGAFDVVAAGNLLDSIEIQFSITGLHDREWLDETLRQVSRQRTDILECIQSQEQELAARQEILGTDLISQVTGKEVQTEEEALLASQIGSINDAITACRLLLDRSGQILTRLTKLEKDLKRDRLNLRESSILHKLTEGTPLIGTYLLETGWSRIVMLGQDLRLLMHASFVLIMLAVGWSLGQVIRRSILLTDPDDSRSDSLLRANGFRYLGLHAFSAYIPALLLLGYHPFASGLFWLELLSVLIASTLAIGFINRAFDRIENPTAEAAARPSVYQEFPERALDRRLNIAVFLLAFWILEVLILGQDPIDPAAQSLVHSILVVLIIVSLLELVHFLRKVPGISRFGHLIRVISLGLLVASLALELTGYHNLSRFLWEGLLYSALLFSGYFLLEPLLRKFFSGFDPGRTSWQSRFRQYLTVKEDEPVPGLVWIRLTIILVLWVLLVLLLLKVWGASDSTMTSLLYMARDGISFGDTRIVPINLLIGVLIFTALLMAARRIKDYLDRKYLSKSRMDSGAREALTTIAGYVGFVVAALFGLSVAGVNFSNIALLAGALSLGIGFGLQNIVNNFVSGIILLFERPIRTGDWIVTGSTQGFVKKIRVRSTEVQTFDRADVIVPNSELISSPVTNWTLRDQHGRVVVPVGVAYGSDTQLVKDLLEEVAQEVPGVVTDDPQLPFKVMFRSFGDSALNFELRCYIHDIMRIMDITSQLHFGIDRKFREHGIVIAFPQLDVHVHKMAPPEDEPV